MKWSNQAMERTGTHRRSTLALASTLPCKPRTPSVPVAHLILVRPMTSLLRLTLLAGLLFFAATASHAVVIYEMKLFNASGRPVELLDKSTGKSWATIPPGRTKSFEYYEESLCAARDSSSLTRESIRHPNTFLLVCFRPASKAQLGSDLRIYFAPHHRSHPPAVHLPPQTQGLSHCVPPHTGLTNRSSQPLTGE